MTPKTRLAMIAVVAAVFAGAWSAGHAQDAAPPAAAAQDAPAAAEAPAGMLSEDMTLIGFIRGGGVTMWPLGFLSVATVALAVYGFMIVRADRMLTPALVPALQDALGKQRLDEAVNICTGTPALLTNILNAGLQRISDGYLDVPSMEKAMEEASVEETSVGLKTISYLSIVAQIAPMLGLLGTVSGMIKAFQTMGKGGMGKPELLAGNIGEAMITTLTGLIIGIPAMFLYFYLKNRYTSNVTRLGRVLGNLTHHLVTSVRRAEGQAPEMEMAAQAPAGEQSEA